MNSGSVDLIATDPPFNSKRIYNAPLGSKAANQQFDDRWKWDEVTDEWHDLIATDHPTIKKLIETAVIVENGNVDVKTGKINTGRIQNSIAAFLAWMAPRLIEMHRILKPTGSLYLHCDSSANSYLKLLLDAVFGRNQFRDEIIWHRTGGAAKGSQHKKRSFGKDCDTIYHYTKTDRYVHNGVYRSLSEEEAKKKFPKIDDQGRRYNTATPIFCAPSMGPRPNLCYTYKDESRNIDVTNPHPSGWRVSKEELRKMDENGEIIWHPTKRPKRKALLSNYKGEPCGCLWTDIPPVVGKKRSDWKTEKPVKLYERIIMASSNPGDIVLDPFAGCATTCVAAEILNRSWVGIDIDPVAEQITKTRLFDVSGLNQEIDNSFLSIKKHPPARTDITLMSPDKMRLYLWKRQGQRCANPYCSLGVLKRVVDLELDHIIPRSRGGPDDISNRIGLCSNCNRRKSAKALGMFLDEERSRQPHPSLPR